MVWTEITSFVVCSNDGDALVRHYDSSWVYSTQSLYDIVNFRGVIPAFIPTVREIRIPPKLRCFCGFFSNNKLMTVDKCVTEPLVLPGVWIYQHLFYDYVTAKYVWNLFHSFSGHYMYLHWLSWKMALRKEMELGQQYLLWNTVGDLANKKWFCL